jgi:hypothetical protein
VTSLDELLRYEEEPPPPPPPRDDNRRWAIRVGVVSVLGAGVAYALLLTSGVAIPYLLLLFILVVAQVVRRVLVLSAADPVPSTLRRSSAEWPGQDQWAELPRDGLHLATARWDTRLGWMRLRDGPEQFARNVQPRLVEIIDERLRLKHGITRAREPERARAVLGETLWRFVTAPVTWSISGRDVAALIEAMEGI